MRTAGIVAACLTFTSGSAFGQSDEKTFEVASVKLSGPRRPLGLEGIIRGGPGSNDPERMLYPFLTLRVLLTLAYSVQPDQVSGPSWIDDTRYDIAAKVPPGVTKQQVNVMLQNLLAERFGLTFHLSSKEFPVYELTIAKIGSKLKETTELDLVPLRPGDVNPSSMPSDRNGFPQLPAGRSGTSGRVVNGVVRQTFRGVPLSTLISLLGVQLGTETGGNSYAPGRIIDKTGLTGKFDFTLETSAVGGGRVGGALLQTDSFDLQEPSGGSSLFDALEKQLGLKVERKKASFEVLVIDHAEKSPKEN
jgi:uncharacterized protein (TIGR03435 family)